MRPTSLASIALALMFIAPPALAASDATQLQSNARAALSKLYASTPSAKVLGEKAHAILVFPAVQKAGFMVGGQYGEGVLFKQGQAVEYYNTAGASYGLQAGAQQYGYALFFMNEAALADLNDSNGFEVGTGPSVVVVDQGIAKSMSSTTLTSDVYAFIFNQQGLMAGLGIQGNKITKVESASGWTATGTAKTVGKDVGEGVDAVSDSIKRNLPW
ncbi:MAG: YSC84-related protein [Alphaproteobacteria bacterium]